MAKRVFKFVGKDKESGKRVAITVELDAPKGELTRDETASRVDNWKDGVHRFLQDRHYHVSEIREVKL